MKSADTLWVYDLLGLFVNGNQSYFLWTMPIYGYKLHFSGTKFIFKQIPKVMALDFSQDSNIGCLTASQAKFQIVNMKKSSFLSVNLSFTKIERIFPNIASSLW
jgi:hypothetical protein